MKNATVLTVSVVALLFVGGFILIKDENSNIRDKDIAQTLQDETLDNGAVSTTSKQPIANEEKISINDKGREQSTVSVTKRAVN